MKIGYPCINRSMNCKSDRTFRLRNYSEARLIETVGQNLQCLYRILEYNIPKRIHFFRITSDLVPFASHPVNKYGWQEFFRREFLKIGNLVRQHSLRISMHPDQFTLINSIDPLIFKRSVAELEYHADVLNLMGLDMDAKIQIHVGGVYGEKKKSMRRFVSRYKRLTRRVRKRLVIENDEHNYKLTECLALSRETNIPVLFDAYHHERNNDGESIAECLKEAGKTWKSSDGIPMIDYSQQKKGATKGAHAESIDIVKFRRFLEKSLPYDFDIMLEIKDKEKSALKAVRVASSDIRFLPATTR
ncbi:MAG: UV DNA damage repair endonuclease UvsE [candidate division WOR-3 bacterium]|nr:MAG: UV DNA damage repair endonuclease UvsE [candidate division WOR-3 bacterium]